MVHHAEAVDIVAFGAVVLLQFDGEILVLLVPVGVHVEYHQVLFAEIGELGRLAVQIEHLDVLHFAGQLLRLNGRCGQREGGQHCNHFHLHYVLILLVFNENKS